MKEEIERTPLRTILTNFLNHIDTLENQRTHDNTYESEFQELKLFSESIKGTKQYSSSEGEKEVNRKKNRYKDILPFDVSRVVLNEYAGVPGSDYINANYIKGASGSPAYIASQGPLPHTVNDFWRMVVQCEVQVIIMACNEEEAGKHKCENYWVEGEGEEKQFGMVTLRLLKASTVCPDFSVRTMRLKYINNQSNTEERTVCQFHYSTWPDHGVPPLVRPLLDMVRLVRDTQASETLPVLIHCSAGCGRTGTICAIDYVWGLLRAGKLTKDFSLLSLVREMRKQRIAMVQTKEQYVLVHQAVRELFKEQLRMIDSHPYENIDCNGLPLIKFPSPEPTYDSLSHYQNNKSEEKQDEKEKEIAPPLPQKKRFQILSSKQAKEVENLSERQRLVEQGGSSSESVTSTGSSGPRPCIATLRSLFERQHAEQRDSRQVSRSHSLGSVRPPTSHAQAQPISGPVEVKEPSVQKPIAGRGILRVPQRPALPVKRSKSLRVLGSGDRCKLSIPPLPPCEVDMPRRLSLESNFEDLVQNESSQQPLSDYLSVDSIVAGLGVRERRNSFRQAVRRESQEALTALQKKPSLLRSYTSVDMRSAREKPNIIKETLPTKPILKPKPNTHPKSNSKTFEAKKITPDPRLQFLNQQQISSKHFPDLYDLNRSQVKTSSSRALTTHSMSLRLAPKPKREDCRVLLSTAIPKTGNLQQIDSVYSSGESSMSCSSDQSSLNSKSLSNSLKNNTPTQLQVSNTKSESLDLDGKDKQVGGQSFHHQNISSSRNVHDSPNSVYRQNDIGVSSGSNEIGQISANSPQSNLGKPERLGAQQYYQRIKPSHKLRRQPPPQSVRPVVYDSKNGRQNTSIYGSTPKASPPPYVEPGKNAQKPRSSPYYSSERQASNKGFHNNVYCKTQDQRQWQIVGSSRDMILPSHSSSNKPNLIGTDIRINVPETTAVKYTRNVERRHLEPDYRVVARDMLSKKASERKPDWQDYRLLSPESQSSSMNERKYVDHDNHMKNERRGFETGIHRSPQDTSSKNPVDRRYTDQTFRTTIPETYVKSCNEKKSLDQKLLVSTQEQLSKALSDRRKQELKTIQQEAYNRNSGEIRMTNQEVSCNPKESASKFVERRHTKEELHTRSSAMVDKDTVGVQEQYHSPVERRPLPNHQPSSEELYPKMTVSSRTPADQNFQHNSQDPRTIYMSRMARTHPLGSWNATKDIPVSDRLSNESETSPSHGVKMRRGSQDDLALCATTPSRVKRHASVVMLRHSLIEGDPSAAPLTVWSQTNSGSDPTASQTTPTEEDPWSGAVGVDLDQVAASINTQKDGKMMRAALEALHLRKASQATPKSTQTTPKTSQQTSKLSQSTVKSNHQLQKSSHMTSKSNPSTSTYSGDPNKTPGPLPQFQPPPEVTKSGPFRKQQQYL